MGRKWQLQEAKNRFSEVVDEALNKGPQIITRRGVETVIVVSSAEYRKMALSRIKLSDFFRESPLTGVNMDLSRDKSDTRSDIKI